MSARPGMDITPLELFGKLKRKEPVILLDVRETDEHEFVNLPDSYLIPLGQIESRLPEIQALISQSPEATLIAYCRVGGRSERAAGLLAALGIGGVRNLAGGIWGWNAEVDPEFPVY